MTTGTTGTNGAEPVVELAAEGLVAHQLRLVAPLSADGHFARGIRHQIANFPNRRNHPHAAEVAAQNFEDAALARHPDRSAQLACTTELHACRHRTPPGRDFELQFAVGLDSALRVVGVANQTCVARHHEAQLVEQMCADVNEDPAAAARAGERRQRCQLPGILAAFFDVHADRRPEQLGFEQSPQQSRDRQETPVQPDAQADPGFLRGGDHLVGIGARNRHRLLDEHMEAPPDQVNRGGGVMRGWRGQDDAIGVRARHSRHIVVDARDAVRRTQFGSTCPIAIDESDDVDLVVAGQHREKAGAGDRTASDDDDPEWRG